MLSPVTPDLLLVSSHLGIGVGVFVPCPAVDHFMVILHRLAETVQCCREGTGVACLRLALSDRRGPPALDHNPRRVPPFRYQGPFAVAPDNPGIGERDSADPAVTGLLRAGDVEKDITPVAYGLPGTLDIVEGFTRTASHQSF